MAEQQAPKITIEEVLNRIAEVNNRLRILEENITQQRKKMELIDNTMNSNNKGTQRSVEEMKIKIESLFNDFDDTKNTIRMLIKQMQAFAPQSELKVLKKYVDLFDPTQMLTKEEVENIIEKKLRERMK